MACYAAQVHNFSNSSRLPNRIRPVLLHFSCATPPSFFMSPGWSRLRLDSWPIVENESAPGDVGLGPSCRYVNIYIHSKDQGGQHHMWVSLRSVCQGPGQLALIGDETMEFPGTADRQGASE
jgi:hypothetical protein